MSLFPIENHIGGKMDKPRTQMMGNTGEGDRQLHIDLPGLLRVLVASSRRRDRRRIDNHIRKAIEKRVNHFVLISEIETKPFRDSGGGGFALKGDTHYSMSAPGKSRSEERRVGKEGATRV